MQIKVRKIILLHFTVLFYHLQVGVHAKNQTQFATLMLPTPTPTVPSMWNAVKNTIVSMETYMPYGINQTRVGFSIKPENTMSTRTKYVTPRASNTTTDYVRTVIVMPKMATVNISVSKTMAYSTSAWLTSTQNPISRSTHHPISPSTTQPNTTLLSPSPTQKSPKTTASSQPLVHKVGLIVGIVLGLVILSVCLVVFHKKETRLKCLKLLCRPCTRSYRSRYNIVPIYVYDDAEQDIRELQDDSDLPLV